MEHLQKLEYLTTNKASILSLRLELYCVSYVPKLSCMRYLYYMHVLNVLVKEKKKNYLPLSKYAFIVFNLICLYLYCS